MLQNDLEAVKWWRKAAEMGFPCAQYKLAEAFRNGYGVKQDSTDAARWYKDSAEKGFADAQYQLGCLYAKGTGVRKDIKEARSWWEKAAQQGDEKSKLSLRRLRASAYRQGACAAALMCGMVLAVVLA